MRTAWLECATGISGDMTLAALIDAGADPQVIRAAIQSLGLPDVRLRLETVIKGGFRSLQALVDHPEQNAHRHLSDIQAIVQRSSLTARQQSLALQMFQVIAEAEARVHGVPVETIHFHEVGAIDSIVDIVGVAVAFDLLQIERVICNAVPPGRGFVRIDHGICPVPTPGTAEILKGIPLAVVPVDAELTTPTGAAIVKVLADSFGPLPGMTIEAVGCGCGSMTFAQRANVLRVFIGTVPGNAQTESVTLLETTVDDVSGETVGYVRERLTTAGALDVWVVPVQMKKGRPGVIISCLCRPNMAAGLEQILFVQTGTLGVRRLQLERSVRQREAMTVQTVWGPVAGKRGWGAGAVPTFAPEFESCAAVAEQAGVSLRDVYRAAEAAWLATAGASEGTAHSQAHDHSHDHSRDHDHGGRA